LLFVIATRLVILMILDPTIAATQAVCQDVSQVEAGWEGFRNRLLPPARGTTHQDFGWSDTQHAGGKAPGEIGGWVQRSLTPARYLARLRRKLTLDDRLVASGRLAVTNDQGDSGVLIGWVNSTSRGWRTPNSLAMRVDGNGGKYWLFFEYGTKSGRTGGAGAFKGERYQNTPTKPFAAGGTSHRWRLAYDPRAHQGVGQISLRIDDRTYVLPLRDEDRADGAVFDRFGVWNQEATGGRLQFWLDDLVVNGVPLKFDRSPDWTGSGNRAEFQEQTVRPYHDFGLSRTTHTVSGGREIGGIIWRDERPCYYADRTAPLTLDTPLSASGTITFLHAGPDSGVYLGWFNARSKRENNQPKHQQRQKNYLGILLEGPSRVGHYFRPGYATETGTGLNSDRGPVLRADGRPHRWSLHYDPQGADRRGEITVTLDGAQAAMALDLKDRKRGAAFDRFGLFNIQSGGWHVELYVGDLKFTTKPVVVQDAREAEQETP